MNFEMRDLKASDFGIMCKIISGIGFKKIKDCLNIEDFAVKDGENKEEHLKKIGAEVLFNIGSIIIENVPVVQSDIDRFLSSLTNKTIKEIQDLSLGDYAEAIIMVVKKDEFKDFFNRVVKLFNP